MKTQKKVNDNFSDFLSSYDEINTIHPDSQSIKTKTDISLDVNSDNFSTFLSTFDGPLQKINSSLDNISKAINRIEKNSADANNLQSVIDTINAVQIPPIVKAMESVKQLNKITSDFSNDLVQANVGNYKEILKEYIDIAEQTSNNEIAAETLNLSEKIISNAKD